LLISNPLQQPSCEALAVNQSRQKLHPQIFASVCLECRLHRLNRALETGGLKLLVQKLQLQVVWQ
jgi:hypothetical protein